MSTIIIRQKSLSSYLMIAVECYKASFSFSNFVWETNRFDLAMHLFIHVYQSQTTSKGAKEPLTKEMHSTLAALIIIYITIY